MFRLLLAKEQARSCLVDGGSHEFVLRQAFGDRVVLAVLLAWWFPAPLLLRTELVDWGRLHESRYVSSVPVLASWAWARPLSVP